MASWQFGKHTVIMKEESFLLFLLAIQPFLTQCLETLCMLLAGDYTDISGVDFGPGNEGFLGTEGLYDICCYRSVLNLQ